MSSRRTPSKHKTLNQCWADVGPASQTLGQNFVTPNCRKIDDGNPDNSNTDINAYSETTFGPPTVGYGMTEN